jgi:hypothetical protein
VAVADEDWATLGVPPGAPVAVARAAYLRRAQALHPDHHPDASPLERIRLDAAMAAVNLAWHRIATAAAAPAGPPGAPHAADVPPPAPPAPEPSGTWWPDGFLRTGSRQARGRWALRLWTDDLEPLHQLARADVAPHVVALDLHDRPVADRDLSLLRRLPGLERLDLSGSAVTDAGLPHLAALPVLRDLGLADTAVTDAGLPDLARCRALASLNLYRTAVTGAGLVHLAGLRLATLNLRGTAVEAGDLEPLLRWPALSLLAAPHVDRATRLRFATARPDVVVT